ncbi:MAG TPA: hypothetical protein PLV92_15655, partial [Pirellulaceae bacterium]|nr:hypothetical protein [Pirellulaceae bacterium]
DLLSLLAKLRKWYGHDSSLLAPADPSAVGFTAPTFELLPPELHSFGDTPAYPTLEQMRTPAAADTHLETFRVYVPWVAWSARKSLPADYLITGITPDGSPQVNPLDLNQYLAGASDSAGSVSLTGPFTAESRGFVPVAQPLPFTVDFQNDPAAPTYTSEIRVVVKLDEQFDARSFRLGDIRIGDIDVDVPEDRAAYQEDRDFTASRGFILRVSAGVDLDSHAAVWLLQAIDPRTGELLQDPTKGLLRPNNARGQGAGQVGYTVQVSDDVPTGARVRTTARVLLDNAPPADAAPLRFLVDNASPTTVLRVTQNDSTYQVDWTANDAAGGSGVKHVTLYVATDDGPYMVWQRQVTDAAGSRVFVGLPGHTYEFLALATDLAGNRERPAVGRAVPDDGRADLGDVQTNQNTAANDGQAATAGPQTGPSNVFVRVAQGVPSTPPSAGRAEFPVVMQPFSGRAFATGVPVSGAGIGPLAIAEAPDGSVLVSGGAARNLIYRLPAEGGSVGGELARLDEPVFNLAFDRDGRLWATTGGGPLLRLDPVTGNVISRHGDGVTIALAPDLVTGEIYVTTNRGVEIFDPDDNSFRRFSRDLDRRFGSLAFDNDGALWGVSWPDRTEVVRFTTRARAEVMYRFDSPIDSLAFGQRSSPLAGLLFVTHNSGVGSAASELTLIDLSTSGRTPVARGGTRGDAIITTRAGRVLLSQSHQVDLLTPQLAPSVIATNPPEGANVALPMSLVTVRFDDDMFPGDASDPGSVLNPTNYRVVNSSGLEAK